MFTGVGVSIKSCALLVRQRLQKLSMPTMGSSSKKEDKGPVAASAIIAALACIGEWRTAGEQEPITLRILANVINPSRKQSYSSRRRRRHGSTLPRNLRRADRFTAQSPVDSQGNAASSGVTDAGVMPGCAVIGGRVQAGSVSRQASVVCLHQYPWSSQKWKVLP